MRAGVHARIGFAPGNRLCIGFAEFRSFDSVRQIGFDLQILFFDARGFSLAAIGEFPGAFRDFFGEFGFRSESQIAQAVDRAYGFGFVS